jgi:hypothetical protein
LSSATLNWLADLIRGHMKEIGSWWRALPAGKIAGIVLARPGQGPHGSEVGDRAGAGPAGPHEQGSRPMADDLVAGPPRRTWPSIPTPTQPDHPTCSFHDAHCSIGMLVVTVRPMRLADGWWPVIIAVVGSSDGELVYETALPRLVYDLQRQGADIGTRSDACQKRVIKS